MTPAERIDVCVEEMERAFHHRLQEILSTNPAELDIRIIQRDAMRAAFFAQARAGVRVTSTDAVAESNWTPHSKRVFEAMAEAGDLLKGGK